MDKYEKYDAEFVEFLQSLSFNYSTNQRKNGKNATKLFRKIISKFLDIYVHDIDDFFASPSLFQMAMEYHIDELNIPNFIKVFIMDSTDFFARTFNGILSLPEAKECPISTKLLSTFMPKSTRVLDVGAGEYPMSTVFLGTNFDTKVIGMEKDECFFSNDTLERFNAEVRHQTFTPYTNVDDFDLLTGFAPCDATQALVQNAVMHNKPYFIRFCECNDIEEWKELLLPIDNNIKFCNDYAYNMDVSPAQMNREIEKNIYHSKILDPHDIFGDLEEFDFSYYKEAIEGIDITDILISMLEKLGGKIKE